MYMASYDRERYGVRVSIREFDSIKDLQEVKQLERRCEVGLSGKICLFTDFMGDPLCRVRHNTLYVMLVAELGEHREIVGLIRGCIKTVVRSMKNPEKQAAAPTYTKAGYILGLRVSPSHRRMGIGLKLVQSQERWLKENGAEYAYMATEKDNEASMKLFVEKCNFSKFRTPTILVHPVYAHSKKKAGDTQFVKLDPLHAVALYRHCLGATEFFPRDIHHVLNHKINLGTWVAFFKSEQWQWPTLSADDITIAGEGLNVSMPSSWAVVSVWNTSAAFRLQVKGVPLLKRAYAAATRFFDRIFPFVEIPSIPNVFHPFGLHFLYGLHAEGPEKLKLMGDLWWLCHNLAKQKESRKSRVRVIATELSSCDPLRHCIPHWNSFSCPEDLWCIKKLVSENETDRQEDDDWVTSPPGLQMFVDPREF